MKHNTNWKASIQPRKQRKYRRNAPRHLLGKFIHSHLSKDLRQKFKTRSVRVRKGDTVVVLTGDFKGSSGKVERINVRACKVYVTGVEVTKRDGSKTLRPVHPSNLVIKELDTADKRRMKKWAKTT